MSEVVKNYEILIIRNGKLVPPVNGSGNNTFKEYKSEAEAESAIAEHGTPLERYYIVPSCIPQP